MSLLVLGVNHRTAPVEVRERLTIGEGHLPSALHSLAKQAPRGVVLSTCNRLEVYALTPEGAGAPESVARLRRFVSDYAGLSEADLAPFLYHYLEGDCVRHLFRVASGLDSMVVGEWEILGQIREAFSAASNPQSGDSYVKGPLSRLFHQALRVGRRVHHDANLGSNLGDYRRRSVSHVGVRLAHRLIGDLSQKQVLLIGAGEAGQLAGRALVSTGASNLVVINRTYQRAQALSMELGGVAAPFDLLPQSLVEADVVISTTSSPDYLVHFPDLRQAMECRPNRPLLLVDIAVPRDIDPEVASLQGVSLYDIDGLSRTSDAASVGMEPEIAHAEALATQEAAKFMEWWHSLDVISAVATIREYAEEVRRAEVEKTLSRLRHQRATTPYCSEETELDDLASYLDAMTTALVKKLMHHPTMYLKEGNDPARQQVIRNMFRMDETGGRHGRR